MISGMHFFISALTEFMPNPFDLIVHWIIFIEILTLCNQSTFQGYVYKNFLFQTETYKLSPEVFKNKKISYSVFVLSL